MVSNSWRSVGVKMLPEQLTPVGVTHQVAHTVHCLILYCHSTGFFGTVLTVDEVRFIATLNAIAVVSEADFNPATKPCHCPHWTHADSARNYKLGRLLQRRNLSQYSLLGPARPHFRVCLDIRLRMCASVGRRAGVVTDVPISGCFNLTQ